MNKKIILCIDGGGTRGVIPATIINLLCNDLNKEPRDLFYLMAGTSTGGILCTGYAFGIKTDVLLNLYLKKAKKIFADNLLDDLRDGFGKSWGADYSNEPLRKELLALFGTSSLHDIQKAMIKRKLDHGRLMVCTFDLSPRSKIPPKNYINFRPKIFHSEFIRDQEECLVDICLRTSAGPTYFPIYQHYVDGGVTMNNPSMAALAYALNDNPGENEYRHPDGIKKGLGLTRDNIKILSLGCGTSNMNFITEEEIKKRNDGDWGNLQWVKYLPDMLTESNMQATEYYVQQVLDKKSYKRIQLYFDDDNAPDSIKKYRGKRLGLDYNGPRK